jgi:hypothetical protein
MELQFIKHHICTRDKCDGILLVDVETEMVPCTDKQGNRLYYCAHGHVFAVDAQDQCILCSNKQISPLSSPSPE